MRTTNALLDLAPATIWTPTGVTGPEAEAVGLLRREIARRTLIHLPATRAEDGQSAVIRIGSIAALQAVDAPEAAALLALGTPGKPESFHLRVEGGSDGAPVIVSLLGQDARGVLFGVGQLLRQLRMGRERLALPAGLDISTAPAYPLRGHQLGYRDKTNSYDGWDLTQWEQYICELAIFGANAIEVMPPRSDDAADSIHFPLPPVQTMIGVSAIAAKYGIDLWIWYPALDEDYTDAATIDFALHEWGAIFDALPRIDAIMVPGGDPGHAAPRVLMALLEKQTQNLHRTHPNAQMWVSTQGYSDAWMEEFVEVLNSNPAWLTGVVYGPWVYGTMEWFREIIPARYPIRNYPDITHSLDCQLPVPDWDVAFALTEGREVINPRPVGEAAVFRHQQPPTIGFLSYSEGCHDDLNKAVWSQLGWNPEAEILEILRDYGRFFIGEAFAEGVAQGILALERNWQGALATNAGVDTTLQQFQALEQLAAKSAPFVLKNWRFQQLLYRAYYDAYVRARLLHEEALESSANAWLRQADRIGAELAMQQAEAVLNRSLTHAPAQDLRTRLFQLAEALFQSPAHMQLNVALYGGQDEVRGATLDGCDAPLNNRLWLCARFAQVRTLASETGKLAALHEILHWCDPGAGGFYDDFSAPWSSGRLVVGAPFADDPDFMTGPIRRFPYRRAEGAQRRSWRAFAGPWHFHPMQMRYTGLDPAASYTLKIVYSSTKLQTPLRLRAGADSEVHGYIFRTDPPAPVTFAVPGEAIVDGELLLTWEIEHGNGGNPAAAGICEIWLVRADAGDF